MYASVDSHQDFLIGNPINHQSTVLYCTVLYCVFEVGSLEVSQADKVLDGIKHIPENARGMLSSIQGQTKTPNRGYAIKLESVP